MVTSLNGAPGPCSVDKIVQRLSDSEQKPPVNAVTIDVLKLMELHLQQRGLIPESVGSAFRYLWFLAETERNIFLWRNGLSISDAENFEFWVNVPALIHKRVRQLELADMENPFTNPLWGESSSGEQATGRERQYLDIFLEIYERSAKHAHAISSMTRMISRELHHTPERVSVTIPRTSAEPQQKA